MNIIICGNSGGTVGHEIAKALYAMGQCKNIEIIDINKLNQDVEALAKVAQISIENAKDLIIKAAAINMPKLETIDLSKIDLSTYFPIEKRSKKNRNRKKWQSPYKYHR